MAQKIIYSNELTENIFMGIAPPNYEKFAVKLIEKVTIGNEKKSRNEVSRVHNYELSIEIKDIAESHLKELGEQLKDLFQLKWVPYDWKTKTYNYYTSSYQEESVKRSQLTQIFDYLKEFENEYGNKVAHSIDLFNQDAISKKSYKDHEIVVKYDEVSKNFVVLALLFIGGEKYSLLSKASLEHGKLSDSLLQKDFFSDLIDLGKKDPLYFMIKPDSYISVRDLIEKKVQENIQFNDEQKQYAINFKEEDLPLYNKPNIFDFKIDFNKETNCFHFYCKGYYESINPISGYYIPRNIINSIALNFILSEEIQDNELINIYPNKFHDKGINRDGYYKIPLDFIPSSSKKDKELILPANYIEKLTKIKNNFLQIEDLFSRPEKTIKIIDNDFLSNASTGFMTTYPTIFLADKGKMFLICNYRNVAGNQNKIYAEADRIYQESLKEFLNNESEPILENKPINKKIIVERPFSINMKGVAITFEEMEYFLNKHPWAEQIRANTVYMNTEIWMKGKNANFGISQQDRETMFTALHLNALLANVEKPNVVKKELKKKKI